MPRDRQVTSSGLSDGSTSSLIARTDRVLQQLLAEKYSISVQCLYMLCIQGLLTTPCMASQHRQSAEAGSLKCVRPNRRRIVAKPTTARMRQTAAEGAGQLRLA